MIGMPARAFRLSPAGSGHGLSCGEAGAFIGPVPLLKRTNKGSTLSWEERNSEEVSPELTKHYGLPIDISRKIKGLRAIASALNAGDIARAQITAIFLQIPEIRPLIKTTSPNNSALALILALHESGLLAKQWNSCDHPRWPGGAPDCQGGEFAPKSAETQSALTNQQPRKAPTNNRSSAYPREGVKPVTGNPIPIIPEFLLPEIEAEAEVLLPELEARLEAELNARFGLKPRPYAEETIPASGPKITRIEQESINEIGARNGCHTCGTSAPGTNDGHWIGDHQPPTRLNLSGKPQRLYPHCASCSATQGGTVTQVLRRLFGLGKLEQVSKGTLDMSVLERSVAAPNSILLIQDPTFDYTVPSNTGVPVAHTSSCITVMTLESSRGEETIVRLGSDLETPPGHLIYDGALETPGKCIEVGTSWLERIFLMPVQNDVTRVSIWTNDPTQPDEIWIQAN